ncbi:MAG: hypothetical protein CME36_12130 [unclassified Hahellaceae]|nr:hypothetical protein [Hahellaceae bacterium]|tara:strand:+ start:9535 stop:10827 length:1293 start_codon:yes stop_codon:yes gene_type:complete
MAKPNSAIAANNPLVYVVLFSTLSATSSLIYAKPLNLSAGLDSRFSDNAREAPSNEKSDTETRLNLNVSHESAPGRCTSEIAANIGYGYWHRDTFDPETYTNGNFAGECDLVSQFRWRLSDNLRDVQQDSRGPSTPDNTTRKNVFRTGPSYTLRLSDTDNIQLSAEYENTEFDEPEETDSERVIGVIAWEKLFSSTFSVGLSVTTDQAELDTTEEVDTDTVSLNFDKRWPATRITGSIGSSRIESRFQGLSQESDGLVGDVTLERRLNPSSEIYLKASRQLTDQTSSFDIQFDDFEFNLAETTTVEVTALEAGMGKRFSDSSSINIGLTASRSNYLQNSDQEDRVGFTVGYSRPLANRLDFNARASMTHYRYEDEGEDDDLLTSDLGLIYKASRKLNVSGQIGHKQRTSDVASREYTENWIALGLTYAIF